MVPERYHIGRIGKTNIDAVGFMSRTSATKKYVAHSMCLRNYKDHDAANRNKRNKRNKK